MNPVIAYIGVVLIWSTTPLAVQWSSTGVDFAVALAIRTAIGLILSWLFMRLQGERLPFERNALYLYASSIIGIFGAMTFVYWSSQYITSGLISVLFGLSPIVAGFFAYLWLQEDSFRAHKIMGALFGLAGLVVVFYHELRLGNEGWKGVLGMLLSVTLYSISLVLVKRFGGLYSAAVVNTGGLLTSLPLMIVVGMANVDTVALDDVPFRAVGAIVYLGVVGSFIGFLLYYHILKTMSAGSVMLIPLITPVIAMVLGHVLNAELLSPSIGFGAILILFGLLMYQWPAMRIVFCRKSIVALKSQGGD